MSTAPTSVITCDMEGRIETFNKGATEIFGYTPEDVIGKARVSLFSPGLIVLGHVPGWLAQASETGAYEGRTVFVRKDSSRFAASIKITPTMKGGEQIGFCGVTRPLSDVSPEEVMPEIPVGVRIFRWLVVTRAPFLTATLAPVLIGAAWVFALGKGAFPWLAFALAAVGALLLHVAANTFNDYFDWTSGTDQANNDYFMPFSGGSRSLELGLITPKGLFRLAVASLLIATSMGLALVWLQGPMLLAFGAAGALAAYFYTAPPVRLAARKGLGELTVGLCFGPLMTAGIVFALTGTVAPPDFLVGLPIGLLVTAILWVNQFPDAPSDELMGKHNLVVVLGKKTARWGYALLVGGAYLSMALGVLLASWTPWVLLGCLTLPMALGALRTVLRHYEDRELVAACKATIGLHMLTGLLMAAGLVIGGW